MDWKDPLAVRIYRREVSRRYRKRHPEKTAAQARAYYIKNYAMIRARENARAAIYRAKNQAKIKAAQQAWRNEHPEEHRARATAWRKANPETHRRMMKNHNERRRAQQLGATIADFTQDQWERMKDAYDHRCAYCGNKMKRLEKDHIIPLSKGGNHTYTNIVPACRRCNAKKRDGAVLCPVQPLLVL